MLTLVSKDSVKISDHFDVLCVLIACMVLEIINQKSKNQKSSLIVWNTVAVSSRQCFLAFLTGTLALSHVSVARLPIRGLTTMNALLKSKNKHHVIVVVNCSHSSVVIWLSTAALLKFSITYSQWLIIISKAK